MTIDCSLNPVENEAVVGRLLAEAGDSLQLVEVSWKYTALLQLCNSSTELLTS